jgi:threonine dehydrogenase-like Zn-dependent dehydrogenase
MVNVANRRFERQQIPVPAIGEEDALLRVERNGLCGSDVLQFTGDHPAPHPGIPGHEPVGIIEEIGSLAASRWDVAVGDRVVVESVIPCGQCRYCAARQLNLCLRRRNFGFISTDIPPSLWGGYSQYMYLDPHATLYRVSKDISLDIVAMFNVLACGFGWVQASGLEPGGRVLILGAGQRGLACVLAAKALGAGEVIITGLPADQHKLDAARALGADFAVDVEKEDVADIVAGVTDGDGVDVVLDLVPTNTASVVDAITLVREVGTVVLAGIKGNRAVPGLKTDEIVFKALTIKGVRGKGPESFMRAVSLIESNPLHVGQLHTHTYPLTSVEAALNTLSGANRQEKAISVCLSMWD